MGWNHRILASEQDGETYLEIHEVHYKKDKPVSYTANAITVGAEDLKGITWVLDKMKECMKKPILWKGDKFPNEYNP